MEPPDRRTSAHHLVPRDPIVGDLSVAKSAPEVHDEHLRWSYFERRAERERATEHDSVDEDYAGRGSVMVRGAVVVRRSDIVA